MAAINVNNICVEMKLRLMQIYLDEVNMKLIGD